MKKILLLALMITGVYSFSQTSKGDSDDYVNNMTGNLYKNGMWLPAKKINNEIEGTTYLFKNWDGLYQLNYSNNKYLKLVNLNYNITTKTIESKISNDSVFQFQMNDIVSLKNGNDIYKLFDGELYKQVFNGKKNSLFKNFKVNVIDGAFNPLTQITAPSKYVQKNEYFYLKDNKLEQFKANKKNILKIFADKEEQMKSYIKSNNLNYNDEIDLFKLFNYYEGL